MDSRSSLKSNEELGETSLGPVDYQLYHGPKNTKYLASQLAKGESVPLFTMHLADPSDTRRSRQSRLSNPVRPKFHFHRELIRPSSVNELMSRLQQ